MADLEAAGQHLSFDDILDAVQESKRGRWFLAQYAERVRQQEAVTLLSAIHRLENRMTQLAPQAAASPSAVAAVQGALQKARQDLVKLGLAPNQPSEEARLFAKIAENARKSMPLAVDSNAQIVRTLELVSEIDQVITSAGPSHGTEFFNADAALFERQATPKPVLVAKPPVENTQPSLDLPPVEIKPPQGAKLVIRRSSVPSPMAADEAAAPVPTTTMAESPPTPVAATPLAAPVMADIQHVDTPRIVIIRRRAEDMPDLSMPDLNVSDLGLPADNLSEPSLPASNADVTAATTLNEEAHSAA